MKLAYLLMILIIQSNVTKIVDNAFSLVENLLTHFFTRLKTFIKTVSRIAYVSLIALGVFLWAIGWSTYSARKMIIGGFVLALLTELLV